jgi:hypothetical protein
MAAVACRAAALLLDDQTSDDVMPWSPLNATAVGQEHATGGLRRRRLLSS